MARLTKNRLILAAIAIGGWHMYQHFNEKYIIKTSQKYSVFTDLAAQSTNKNISIEQYNELVDVINDVMPTYERIVNNLPRRSLYKLQGNGWREKSDCSDFLEDEFSSSFQKLIYCQKIGRFYYSINFK